MTEEVGPDPRFGMQSPLTHADDDDDARPGCARCSSSATRIVDLATPGAPLSLRSLTETHDRQRPRRRRSRFDAAHARFTDTSPEGRTLDDRGRRARARPLRVEAPGVTPTVITYDARAG